MKSNTTSSLNLLDGASSQAPIIAPELEIQKRVAADSEQPLETRLEAYEDILESEVGDTSLSDRGISSGMWAFGRSISNSRGATPTGAQKDRIAFAQAMDALRRGFDAICVATCGNYGAAMAIATAMAGLRCIAYIPEGYHTRRTREMLYYGTEIVHVPGNYEDAVMASRARADADEIYDANPGGANTAIQLKAYGKSLMKFTTNCGMPPRWWRFPYPTVPPLAGIYRGFLSLYRRGKTSRIPRMVAGSSHNKNPIIRAYVKSTPSCEDLPPHRIRENPDQRTAHQLACH